MSKNQPSDEKNRNAQTLYGEMRATRSYLPEWDDLKESQRKDVFILMRKIEDLTRQIEDARQKTAGKIFQTRT